MSLFDPDPDWDTVAEQRAEAERDWFGPEQSATACCPRQTIPDSCSCLEDCGCMCLDCDCANWGEEPY